METNIYLSFMSSQEGTAPLRWAVFFNKKEDTYF